MVNNLNKKQKEAVWVSLWVCFDIICIIFMFLLVVAFHNDTNLAKNKYLCFYCFFYFGNYLFHAHE